MQKRGDEIQGYKLELDRYGPKSSAMDALIADADPIVALAIIIGMQNTPEGIAHINRKWLEKLLLITL